MDMRDVYITTMEDLKKKLPEADLTEEQKKLIEVVMDFGYSAAYCQRTEELSQNTIQSELYKTGYKSIKKLI